MKLGMGAIGLLAVALLGACAPDDNGDDGSLAACYPAPYRDTCLAEVWAELLHTCFDGRGRCTWSESRADGGIESRFEWENGASYEQSGAANTGVSATFNAASGERCTLGRLDDPQCYRFASTKRWYEYCVETDGTKFVANHYTCDDGRKVTVTADDLKQQLSAAATAGGLPMCMAAANEHSFDDCVDAAGRRYADVKNPPPPPKCSGDACGDIGARCTDTMQCDQGLTCRNLNVDPSVIYGYCTVSCETTPCPTGTECKNVGSQLNNKVERQCMRPCTEDAACAQFGTSCSTGIKFCN